MKKFIIAVTAISSVYLSGCAVTATTSSNAALAQVQSICSNSLPSLAAFVAAESSFSAASQDLIADINDTLPPLCADAQLVDAGANLQTLTQTVLPQIVVVLAEKAGL